MNFLVAYDIKDAKRLYKVKKAVYEVCLFAQKSALEADLTSLRLKALSSKINTLALKQDKINIIKIIGKAKILGQKKEKIFNNNLVIIL